MAFRWIEHTAEVELELEAPTPEGLLAEAMLGLDEMFDAEGNGATAERDLSVQATERAALLAEWLRELLFLADTEGFVGRRVEEMEIANNSVRARVAGVVSDPQSLVKAVTYPGSSSGPMAKAGSGGSSSTSEPQPLITPIGTSRATGAASPARSTTPTTRSTFL